MVDLCKEKGFDVNERDAVDYLRSLKANNIGVITSFHIIEHVPLNIMIALLDETSRVLKPNGVAIFETPNPEKLLVGACYFYFNMTHIKPLVLDSVKSLVMERGFKQVFIKRINKYS